MPNPHTSLDMRKYRKLLQSVRAVDSERSRTAAQYAFEIAEALEENPETWFRKLSDLYLEPDHREIRRTEDEVAGGVANMSDVRLGRMVRQLYNFMSHAGNGDAAIRAAIATRMLVLSMVQLGEHESITFSIDDPDAGEIEASIFVSNPEGCESLLRDFLGPEGYKEYRKMFPRKWTTTKKKGLDQT